MPKRTDIKKVMVIGSGPIVIGQAAEFDYSGTQACKALREEGVEVVLINSNPATIMTDTETADRVYIEPINLDYVKEILYKERPDGILASLGGQTGLNMAVQLSNDGILDELGIELLGTTLESIRKAEDRELFKETMQSIGEKVPHSKIVTSLEDGIEFVKQVGFPIIIRPAYTLGGTGGGIAENMEDFKYICGKGLKLSMIHQVLLEQSVAGWKEIEFEVMRDGNDNCIIICSMENIDPVGIHTGDSIVVAPCQTLSDKEYQMLKNASIKIIRALNIKGGCNIQFALNPNSFDYVVIEVNPRVSRSSALASKATGYPIARVTAKIALGLNLDEIQNPVTGTTTAFFEPTVDYVVTKVPRWPFDKFSNANRHLGTQMKATGEVMAIGRTFEESLLKAIDSLDVKMDYQLGLSLFQNKSLEELLEFIREPSDERIFAICKALQKGATVEQIVQRTAIDTFFIAKLKNIVKMADAIMERGRELAKCRAALDKEKDADVSNRCSSNDETGLTQILDEELYRAAKKLGFGDSYIANLLNVPLDEVYNLREQYGIHPVYKIVDTCAGEFEAVTPYYYSSYEKKDDLAKTTKPKVVVIGAGPIRIGQGIEFDYCSVHAVKALRQMGIESIIINNNPETVSTDFDTSDKLYFEPLTRECVLDIIRKENPIGVIVQFGGQTAINLAASLEKEGVRILGTGVASIDMAEDRELFLNLLKELKIPYVKGATVYTFEEAKKVAAEIGFPVLVRPSYVLGGRAMEIVHNNKELEEYIRMATSLATGHPILIDKYISGKEIEVDGICDGKDLLIPGIMEHIERAGVHSGDSIAVYPPYSISGEIQERILDYSTRLARALKIVGLFNIQFVMDKDQNVYVIEVNPRASRTVPVMSKITGIPMVNLATRLIMGATLKSLGYGTGLAKASPYYAVKAPVFSFSKLSTVDTFLSPEMKSTGEVMGIDKNFANALYKALVASGLTIPAEGNVLLSVADRDKEECLRIAIQMCKAGYKLVAAGNTYEYLKSHNVAVEYIPREKVLDAIKENKIALVVNTPTRGKIPGRWGFSLRRTAIEYNVPCITSMDTVNAIVHIIQEFRDQEVCTVNVLQDYSRNLGLIESAS